MNEEVSSKAINIAVQATKVSTNMMIQALKEEFRELKNERRQKANEKAQKKLLKANTPVRGKQSVKELIGQGQGVSSIPIGEDIRDFKRIANKYGVDFAIVKDKNQDPPLYTVFFKAKDVDAIGQVLKDYSAKLMKKGKIEDRQSILAKLDKYKEQVKNTPRKEHEKRKEQER